MGLNPPPIFVVHPYKSKTKSDKTHFYMKMLLGCQLYAIKILASYLY